MKILYFDCFAGASGNMILAGLAGLGVNRDLLEQEIRKLDISDFSLEFSEVDRSGIHALHAEVKVPHEHVHRHLTDIDKIIRGSRLSDTVKERAMRIFRRLAEAEAKIHGIDVEAVHFHEVGAMDAIVDVVGACVGFEVLGVEKFACSKIHVGSGFAEMAHGKFPVPPPAVAELLQGIPIYSRDIEGELITPTGAAIISTLCSSYGEIPEMAVEGIGYGAGSRNYERFPNVLRMMLGHEDSSPMASDLVILETNLDDISSQVLGYVMEEAFRLGALDCWFTPIQMKKNRPATMVSILAEPSDGDELKRMLYLETTTLGVRVRNTRRECLEREIISVNTDFGAIDIKVGKLDGVVINAVPEYEQVRSIAAERKVPFRVVSESVISAFNNSVTTSAAKGQ
jgi:uncharacterized protein (TIGR00299 family) protein